MTNVPPVHVINLDRSKERLASFRKWNQHLQSVVRVPAADGAALDWSEVVRQGYVADDFTCAAGTLGCAISHFKLWQKAVRENRALTIMEDDVVVAHRFLPLASRVISELPPDWDLVKWGWTINLSAWITIGVSRVNLHGDGAPPCMDVDRLRSFQADALSAAPISMLHSFGLFGYSISPKGARAALDFCMPLRRRTIEFPDATVIEAAGIDATLCGAYPKMQAFVCLPTLILHADQGDSVRMKMDEAGMPTKNILL